MNSEKDYVSQCDPIKRKKLGQFFTPNPIARFMSNWLSDSHTILDPAVGNNIFFNNISKINDSFSFEGYEIDPEILKYFDVDSNLVIVKDYLLSEWSTKYDGIICNPPYNRFQYIDNRKMIYDRFKKETNRAYSGYTNQYILFLIKSIYQLAENGKLAYIIPNEFLNSKYGQEVKELMIEQSLIRAIINFKENIFDDALTTCCIILLDKKPKTTAEFIHISNEKELLELDLNKMPFSNQGMIVQYKDLMKSEKWLKYLQNESAENTYTNLISMNEVCDIHRGIATGDNDYFLFNKSKIEDTGLDRSCFNFCISSSRDIEGCVFNEKNLQDLVDSDKTVFLLNITTPDDNSDKYLKYGIEMKVDKKYLPAHRKIWHLPEKQNPADIWITTASRGNIKIVLNLTKAQYLTSFHGIYLKDDHIDEREILFCYLLTPIAQEIIANNRKEMGNGLNKYQPADYLNSKILDFSILSDDDKINIHNYYLQIIKSDNKDKIVFKLNDLFTSKLLNN